jgi:hypothetical protein
MPDGSVVEPVMGNAESVSVESPPFVDEASLTPGASIAATPLSTLPSKFR